MLLFIDYFLWSWSDTPQFQYITCYSLSLDAQFSMAVAELFQYITCYSLSSPVAFNECPLITFQYITCYSLSEALGAKAHVKDVFQYITCYSLSWTRNTSPMLNWHVSIHHMLLFIERLVRHIRIRHLVSIHHMLLFIGVVPINGGALSVSIHHMLLFIGKESIFRCMVL